MLSFSDATGNLFNRIGRLGKLVSLSDAYGENLVTYFTDVTDGAVGQYDTESDLQALLGSTYQSFANSPSGVGGYMQGVAASTLSRMIFRDNPIILATLNGINTQVSLLELIRQMSVMGASVLAPTITATPGTFTGYGSGVLVASTRRALDCAVMENSYAETLTAFCTGDSYSGTATAGNEPFTVYGVGAGATFAFTYPAGSGATRGINAIDGSVDGSAGNILYNSGFDAFTSNTPTYWTIAVGTAGTNVFEETTEVYGDGSSLRILGDGTLVSVTQEFNVSTGTPLTLDNRTQYAVNLWMKRDGGAAWGSGQLTVDLVDVGNTVIPDVDGNPNSVAFDLTTLSTTFAAFNTTFRTPINLPDRYFIRYRLTSAIPVGRNLYIDRTALGETTQVYTSGPSVALFSGDTPFLAQDNVPCVVTNSRGVAGTLDTFQTLFARLFPDMLSSELLLPSSATPTISDLLITR
jgi:hypothetical protein